MQTQPVIDGRVNMVQPAGITSGDCNGNFLGDGAAASESVWCVTESPGRRAMGSKSPGRGAQMKLANLDAADKNHWTAARPRRGP